MTVNTDHQTTEAHPEPASRLARNPKRFVSPDDQLADLIFRSEIFARDWATMYNALNKDMSMETPGVPSGSCPDMGRLSSADSYSVPKKVTHPTHTPPIGADSDRGHSDSYDICR